MQTNQSLEALKCLLSDAETKYQHAFAAGDWETMGPAKAQVAKYRNAIGRIIKERLR